MENPLPLRQTPLRISAPYNHAPDFVDRVLRPYASVIGEMYLGIHVAYCHTGRPWVGPMDLDEYEAQLDEVSAACRELGIPMSFVANTFVQPIHAQLLEREITRLHHKFPGSRFTLSTFEIALALHRRDPSMDIQPSTLARVNDATTAWYWKSQIGSKWITLDRAANKKLSDIRAIRKMGLKVRIVADDKCLPNCPAQEAHGTQIRLYDELAAAWPEPGCFGGYAGCRASILPMKYNNFWLVAQKDILPGHLPHLVDLVDVIKLSGRSTKTDSLVMSIERYAKMEELTGSGPFYREPPEAWDRITKCDRVCEACRWCFDNLEALPESPDFGRRR